MSLDDVNDVEPRLLSFGDVFRMRFRPGEEPPALPDVFPNLAAHKVRFRLGELSLVCGPPGHGKSTFALALAVLCGQHTLYLSLDSTDYDMAVRAAAMINGVTMDDIEWANKQGRAGTYFARTEAAAGHVRLRVTAPNDVSEIVPDIETFRPKLIVADNLTDVGDHYSSGNPHEAAEAVIQALKRLAREYDVHIMALHHVTGEYNDGNKPILLSGIKGQTGRVPALVLTIRRDRLTGGLLVYVAKNRHGPEIEVPLEANLAMMRIYGTTLHRPDGTSCAAFPNPAYPEPIIGHTPPTPPLNGEP